MVNKGQILNLLLIVLAVNSAGAQNNSPLGRFSVDYIKGCSPLTIQVTDNSGSGVSVYQYEGSGSATTNQTTYTYSSPGIYYLVQTIQNLSPRQDSLRIEVVSPIQPEFDLLTCENSGVTIQVTDKLYDQYEIDFGDGMITTINSNSPVINHFYGSSGTYTISIHGIFTNAADNCGTTSKTFTTINGIIPASISTLEMLENGELILNYVLPQNILYDIQIAVENANIFQKLKSISNLSSKDTIRNLNLSRNYCFRIISFDPCANNTITSNIVCTLDFAALALDGTNRINWETVSGEASGFSVQRDLNIIASPLPAENEYLDSAITCGEEYCYQVAANFPGGGQTISTSRCVTAFSTSTPETIPDISVSVNNQSLDVSWPQPVNDVPGQYFLERSLDNSDFSLISSLTANSVSGLDSGGCFRVYYEDICGNTSNVSNSGCQLFISFTENQNELQIFWNEYSGWEDGVNNYALEVYDQNMNLISSNDTGSQSTFTLDLIPINVQVLKMRVIATPVDPQLTEIYSFFITYVREPIISLPGAFTPDGDGLNDTYQVYGKFISQITFLVYDRWGKLIFSEKELGEGWDGRIDGKLAPAGAYVYRVEVTDFTGRSFNRSGSFVLLR